MQPIYLLADSRLLFSMARGRAFLHSILDGVQKAKPRAAYVGASNGDRREYFSLFSSAMELGGVRDARMISSGYGHTDREHLRAADIILLAGGDVHLGWQIMNESMLAGDIVERHREGAVLIGVSAGAVQLGPKGWLNDVPEEDDLFDSFGLVPCIVDTHDERNQWSRLRRVMTLTGPPAHGLGLPAGSGIIVHADFSLEPVRMPVTELRYRGLEVVQTVLLPTEA